MELVKCIGKVFITLFYKMKYHSKHVIIKSGARCYRRCIFEGYNVINAKATFTNSYIGYASYVGKNAQAIGIKIGRYCSIGSNFRIYAYSHPSSIFVSTHPSFYALGKQCGMTYVKTQKYDECNSLRDETYNAIIGNDVWIGNDVIIMGGLKIGDGAIIGTGAIITKNVPPYAVVIGVPGKVIKYRFTDDEIGKLLEIQWWNKDKEWISENSDYFDNINRFLSLFPD